jgi:hypothetical protein
MRRTSPVKPLSPLVAVRGCDEFGSKRFCLFSAYMLGRLRLTFGFVVCGVSRCLMSTGNVLGGHSTPAAARQRKLRDLLAGNMGLLRVMYHESGQKNMCPSLAVISADIAEKWGITDPLDLAALHELLAVSRPAGTHQVSDFVILSRVLRRHRATQAEHAHQELLLRQQRTASNKIAAAAVGGPFFSLSPRSPRTTRITSLKSGSSQGDAANAHPTPAAAASSRAVVVDLAHSPRITTGSVSEWKAWLKKCAPTEDASAMTWPQFAAAIQAAAAELPIGKVDAWHARQHFLACCGGHPASVHSAVASIDALARVSQTATPPNWTLSSRASAGTKRALDWTPSAANHPAGLPHPPRADEATADGLAGGGGARPLTAARRGTTRAAQMRTEAIAAAKNYEQLKEVSITSGIPVPLLHLKSIPAPPKAEDVDKKGNRRPRPASAR